MCECSVLLCTDHPFCLNCFHISLYTRQFSSESDRPRCSNQIRVRQGRSIHRRHGEDEGTRGNAQRRMLESQGQNAISHGRHRWFHQVGVKTCASGRQAYAVLVTSFDVLSSRIWHLEDEGKKFRNIIKTRSAKGHRAQQINPTAIAYSGDGKSK